MSHTTSLAVLLSWALLAVAANSTSGDTFIPEEDWKPIKPGQKVPGGLHYRINLETGQQEAKLLAEEEASPPQHAAAIYRDDGQLQEEAAATKKKEAMAQFLEKYQKALKTESELMMSLLRDYQSVAEDEVRVDILQRIEFLVHKYDVGRDFVIQGGHRLLLPGLNATNPHLRANIAFTLGSAMQGNPTVQAAVMREQGTLPLLLHLATQDPHPQVSLRSLYALSCLLRQNPLGQEMFLSQGGVPLLLQACRNNLKLQRKALTLFSDLVTEQKLHLQHHVPSEKAADKEILDLYQRLKLKEQLVENGFCQDILKLGQSSQDLDLVEKVVEAMDALHPACQSVFSSHLDSLRRLLSCQDLSSPFSQMAQSLLEHYTHQEL